MKRRIAIAALAASMVFSMTGCGALRAAYMIGSAIHESSKESDAGSKSDKKEKREREGRKAILLGTPDHKNAGDHLIADTEMRFIREMLQEDIITEILNKVQVP